MIHSFLFYFFFFFNDTATTEIYTLSLHDALPICGFSLPGLSDGESIWRRIGRRHGSRQNGADPHLACLAARGRRRDYASTKRRHCEWQRKQPRSFAEPSGVPQIRHGQLAQRSAEVLRGRGGPATRPLSPRHYDQKDDPFARKRLAARVRPFLLRRAKSQVAQDLPDRVEEDLACETEGVQKTLYRAEFKRAQQMLLRVTTQKELNEQRFNFLTSLLRLRQICCHPALVNDELRNAESAKLNALLDLLEPVMDEGHK